MGFSYSSQVIIPNTKHLIKGVYNNKYYYTLQKKERQQKVTFFLEEKAPKRNNTEKKKDKPVVKWSFTNITTKTRNELNKSNKQKGCTIMAQFNYNIYSKKRH